MRITKEKTLEKVKQNPVLKLQCHGGAPAQPAQALGASLKTSGKTNTDL